ncbi:hypothetical protein JB92DRAFT_2835347 [Gautieria morchelliformis]|nr:hypothetical protein JB92DRAFT_2835347 [Gautieria morchelliformis]
MASTLSPPTLTPSSPMRTPLRPPRTGTLTHPHVAVQVASLTPPPSMTRLIFPGHYKYPLQPLQQGENWYPEIQSYKERCIHCYPLLPLPPHLALMYNGYMLYGNPDSKNQLGESPGLHEQNTIIIGLSLYTGGGERWDRLAAADLVGSVKGGGPEVISWDRWICWDRSQQYYNICK